MDYIKPQKKIIELLEMKLSGSEMSSDDILEKIWHVIDTYGLVIEDIAFIFDEIQKIVRGEIPTGNLHTDCEKNLFKEEKLYGNDTGKEADKVATAINAGVISYLQKYIDKPSGKTSSVPIYTAPKFIPQPKAQTPPANEPGTTVFKAETPYLSKPPLSNTIPIKTQGAEPPKPRIAPPPANLPTAATPALPVTFAPQSAQINLPKIEREKTHSILVSQDIRFDEPREGTNTILEDKMTKIVKLPHEEIDVEDRRKEIYKEKDPYREEPK